MLGYIRDVFEVTGAFVVQFNTSVDVIGNSLSESFNHGEHWEHGDELVEKERAKPHPPELSPCPQYSPWLPPA
jgi:hypothetical protein